MYFSVYFTNQLTDFWATLSIKFLLVESFIVEQSNEENIAPM
jgi:hypothetical protein